MRKRFSLLFVGAAVLLIAPLEAFAQEEEQEPEPEIHYVTVAIFEVPRGEEGQKVMGFIDAAVVPIRQMNPNILHSSVLTHSWGSNSAEVVFVAEYADWAAIEADCEPCDAWLEENRPAEDTPEREKWDAMAHAFVNAFNGHRDEIYMKNMNRAH
jgi:hypothetical protein